MSKARRIRRAHAEQPVVPVETVERTESPAGHSYPADWTKGQLLNVQNAGGHFNVTLLGEEYDPRTPDRTMQFGNSFDCQSFVSWWYARDTSPQPAQ